MQRGPEEILETLQVLRSVAYVQSIATSDNRGREFHDNKLGLPLDTRNLHLVIGTIQHL